MTSVLLLVHLGTVIVVTAVMWALPRINRDTLPFGVRVPPERATDPQVRTVTRRYRWAVVTAGALIAGASAVLWPLLPAGEAVAAGTVLLMGGWLGAYSYAHRVLRRTKAREHWYAGAREGIAVDTTLRSDPVPVPWLGTLPSLLAIAATAATGVALFPGLPERLVVSVRHLGDSVEYGTVATSLPSAFAPVLLQVLTTALLLGMLRFTMRARAELDAARPQESALQHRRFLRGWAYCLLAVVFTQNATLGGLALLIWTDSLATAGPAMVALVAGPVLTVSAFAFGLALLVGQGGWRLGTATTGTDTGMVQRDDDRYWHLAGLVYVSRTDPAFLVPMRTAGLGWTLNLGHPGAWATLSLLALLLVGLTILAATGAFDGSWHYGWKVELDSF